MTTLREAAQQALEALEESEQHYGSDSALRDAIQILRDALEQPEQAELDAYQQAQPENGKANMTKDDIIRIARRYGTPVQEQNGEVEYLFNVDTLIALMIAEQDVPEADCGNMEPVARVLQTVGQYHTGRCVAEVETVRRLRNGESLYTHPPRREWRGLTDTERAAVQHESFKRGLSPLEFMELHEAKLKEKNHE
jgi:hypothetical protein